MSRSSRAVIAALLLSVFAPRGARADLECAEPVVQMGEVLNGAPVAHTFTFVNRGNGLAEIEDVRPSCGCLTPHLEQHVLEPGWQGKITLEVNTLTQADGTALWRCTIVYRQEGQRREMELTLAARVKGEIRVDPAAL